jgi:hypothetical protein
VILMKIFGADGRDNSVENDISFCVFIAIWEEHFFQLPRLGSCGRELLWLWEARVVAIEGAPAIDNYLDKLPQLVILASSSKGSIWWVREYPIHFFG